MSESANGGSFETTAAELLRVLSLIQGRGDGGKSAYERVGIVVESQDPPLAAHAAAIVRSAQRSRGESSTVCADWYGPVAAPGSAFRFATFAPAELLDYLKPGLFDPASPVRLVYDEGGRRIRLTDGVRTVTTSTSPFDEVPRPKDDEFGRGPGGTWITSHPDRRPKAASADWTDWVRAGFTVARVPLASLLALLAKGDILFGHNQRGILYTLDVHPDGVEATLADPKKPTADSIHEERLAGVEMPAGVQAERFVVQHASVAPIWSSLRLLKCASVVLVHHPAEKRINLVASEDGEDGTPILRLTSAVMAWADPRTKTSAKAV